MAGRKDGANGARRGDVPGDPRGKAAPKKVTNPDGFKELSKYRRKTKREPKVRQSYSERTKTRPRKNNGREQINWPHWRTIYVIDPTQTYASISKQAGVSDTSVGLHASREDWGRLRLEHQEHAARELRERARAELVSVAARTVVDTVNRASAVTSRLFDFLERSIPGPDDDGMVPFEDVVSERTEIPESVGEDGKISPRRFVTRTRRIAPVNPEVLRAGTRGLGALVALLHGVMRMTDGKGDGGVASMIDDPIEEKVRKFQRFQEELAERSAIPAIGSGSGRGGTYDEDEDD